MTTLERLRAACERHELATREASDASLELHDALVEVFPNYRLDVSDALKRIIAKDVISFASRTLIQSAELPEC